ncbi:MAG: galactose oxidase, partial [Pseudomonadota bacterium]
MPINSITRRHAVMLGAASSSFACSARPLTQPESSAFGGNWRTGPALPVAVQEIYPTRYGGQIHLAGGFVSDGTTITGATDRHIGLDPMKGVWSDHAPLPVARHHPNLISFSNRLFAIGGFEARSEQAVWVMQSGVWAYNGDDWSAVSDLPQPNGESVTAVLNNQLHVCGGRTPKGSQNATWQDHSDVADHFSLAHD